MQRLQLLNQKLDVRRLPRTVCSDHSNSRLWFEDGVNAFDKNVVGSISKEQILSFCDEARCLIAIWELELDSERVRVPRLRYLLHVLQELNSRLHHWGTVWISFKPRDELFMMSNLSPLGFVSLCLVYEILSPSLLK